MNIYSPLGSSKIWQMNHHVLMEQVGTWFKQRNRVTWWKRILSIHEHGGPSVRKDVLDRGVLAIAYLPLIRGEDLVGILYVHLLTSPPVAASLLPQSDRHLLRFFAKMAVIAIENAQVQADRERKIRELEALTVIGQAVSTLGVDDILDLVYEQMSKIMGLQDAHVQISLSDGTEMGFPLAIETNDGKIIDRIRWGKREPEYSDTGSSEYEETLQPRLSGERFGLNEYIIKHRKPLFISEDFEEQTQSRGIEVWPTFGRLRSSYTDFPWCSPGCK